LAAYFNLTLDTIAPSGLTLTINSGVSTVTSASVTLGISVSDGDTTGYSMLLYGDIGAGLTEGTASWENFATNKSITLKPGDGSKTVKAKVKDDVGNVSSEATVTVTLDTTVPVVTISAGPDYSKISTVTGHDTCTFSFTVDSAFVEYKVKIVPATSSTNTAGTQIGTVGGSTNMSGSGTFAASTPIQCTIDGSDLSTAVSGVNNAHIVKVFAKDEAGLWSV
jgi:hypothetical protein